MYVCKVICLKAGLSRHALPENLERYEPNKNGRGTEQHIEMKQNENEYFGQIPVAFLSSRIQETEAKLLMPLGRGWNVGGLKDVETRDTIFHFISTSYDAHLWT